MLVTYIRGNQSVTDTEAATDAWRRPDRQASGAWRRWLIRRSYLRDHPCPSVPPGVRGSPYPGRPDHHRGLPVKHHHLVSYDLVWAVWIAQFLVFELYAIFTNFPAGTLSDSVWTLEGLNSSQPFD